jgi:hypothetical protein
MGLDVSLPLIKTRAPDRCAGRSMAHSQELGGCNIPRGRSSHFVEGLTGALCKPR